MQLPSVNGLVNEHDVVQLCRPDALNDTNDESSSSSSSSSSAAPPPPLPLSSTCETIPPDACQVPPYLPSCPYKVVTYDVLKANPMLLYNPSPPITMQDQVYIIYYQDDNCRDFAGFQSLLEGPVDLHLTMNASSCLESMVCAVHPQSPACWDIATNVYFTYTETRGEELWTCNVTTSTDDLDGSLVVEAIPEQCELRNESVCIVSTIHPGCSYRVAMGRNLVRDPTNWLPPTIPTTTTTTSTSSAVSSFSSLSWIASKWSLLSKLQK